MKGTIVKYPTRLQLFSSDERGHSQAIRAERGASDCGLNVERLLITDPRENAKEDAKVFAVFSSASFLSFRGILRSDLY